MSQAPVSSNVKTLFTTEDATAFMNDIATRVLDSNNNFMHSMLALNELLRRPEAAEIFQGDLKEQAKDLWLKIKLTGLQLNDPPLLFGFPEVKPDEEEKFSGDSFEVAQ